MLAFSIDTITAPMDYVDVRPALKVFPDVNCLATILRPVGEVDLLLRIHYSELHPVLADPVKHRVGNLRLLTSRFGNGYLLDSAHPDIKVVASLLKPGAKEKAQAMFFTKCGKPPKTSHGTA